MKKAVRISVVILSIFAVCVLVSCSFKKPNTESLTNDLNQRLASYDSFEVNVTLDMQYFVDDVALNVHSEGREIFAGLTSGDFQTYMKYRTKVTSEKSEYEQTNTTTEGYYDGKYFLTTNGDYFKQKIYSNLSTDEARDFVIVGDMIGFDTYLNCKNKSTSVGDDGSITMILSGYSKGTLEEICDQFGIDQYILGAMISDVKVCIIADESYLVREIQLEFVFEKAKDEENATTAKIVAEYVKFGEARVTPEMVNLQHHTEIEDIRVLKMIENMMYDLYNSSSNSFDISVTQTVEIVGETDTQKLSQKVAYGNDKDGYFFKIEDNLRNEIVEYKNGKQTTSSLSEDGYSDSVDKTDFEAKSEIVSLINTCGYSIPNVTDIKMTSEGVYELKCSYSIRYRGSSVILTGWNVQNIDQTIKITTQNDQIVKIESQVEITGIYKYYQYGYIGVITVDSTVEFEAQEKDNVALDANVTNGLVDIQ